METISQSSRVPPVLKEQVKLKMDLVKTKRKDVPGCSPSFLAVDAKSVSRRNQAHEPAVRHSSFRLLPNSGPLKLPTVSALALLLGAGAGSLSALQHPHPGVEMKKKKDGVNAWWVQS